MPEASIPPDEDERLSALYELNILDTPPEERFDRLSRLATRVFNVPIAYVAFLERDRQWFKSACGLGDMTETPRRTALCSHTILSEDGIVCPDATEEPRFNDNPYVLGAPGVRFYMGHPLTTADGHRVGTFCVIDVKPRQVTEEQVKAFRDLAALAETELHLMDSVEMQRQLRESRAKLRQAYLDLAEVHEALRQSQAQLIQSSKMAAVGQLAGGVAHELNSPLGAIMMSVDAALRSLKTSPDKAFSRLERAGRAANQMKEIIRKLLIYSRDSTDLRQPTRLNNVVEDTLQLIGHQMLIDNVKVECNLAAGLPELNANPTELQQVLTNLVLNARDAIKSGNYPRKLIITTDREGDELLMAVQDFAHGMDEATRARVLEPFFTTKPVGEGTGLGLSVSLQLVQAHGGRLEIDSAVGCGATFRVRLPLEAGEN